MKEDKLRLILVVAALSLAYVIMDLIFLDRHYLAAGICPDLLLPAVVLVALFHRPSLDFKKDYLQMFLVVICLVSLLPFWPSRPSGIPLKLVLSPALIFILMVAEGVVMDARRYSKVSRLFRNEAVWHNVLRDSRSFYFSLAQGVACLHYLSLCHKADGISVLSVIADLCALALIVTVAVRLVSGHTLYMTKGHEDELKSLLRGNLRTQEVAEGVKEKKMKALYKKILDYFEEKKPYLDENVSLDDISRSLYTNKSYLSKTVNVLSGQNFRQFVNYYRIEYAVELIRRDPHLKVEELAMMSGFHNPVSFNMAFRLFKGKTPSEWIHEHRASLR